MCSGIKIDFLCLFISMVVRATAALMECLMMMMIIIVVGDKDVYRLVIWSTTVFS